MASRCLGELVRKMGDRVLRVIVPILRTDMGSDSGATRQGVCYGLKELMDNVSRQQLAEHLSTLLPTLQGALLDPDAHVRTVRVLQFFVSSSVVFFLELRANSQIAEVAAGQVLLTVPHICA